MRTKLNLTWVGFQANQRDWVLEQPWIFAEAALFLLRTLLIVKSHYGGLWLFNLARCLFFNFFFGGGTFLLNTWINYCYIAITPFNSAWILNQKWCFIYLVSNEPKISIVHLSVFNFFAERKIFSAVALIEIIALYLYYVFYIKFHSFLGLVMKL